MKKYKLIINGVKYETFISEYTPLHAKVNVNGREYYVEIEDDTIPKVPKLERTDKSMPVAPALSSSFDAVSGTVKAPLPGVIHSIAVQEGDIVKKGDTIMVLEAMKMQSEIAAPISGKVTKIYKKEKSLVQEGEILLTIESDKPDSEIKPDKIAKSRRMSDKLESLADNIIRAPLPGTILDVLVNQGDDIYIDQTVMILEAMKMESEIHSPKAGKVKKIMIQKGSSVQEGDALLELED